LASSIIPHIEFTPAFAMMFVAILGTTITPYVFFWQASQEAEENVVKGKIKEISEDKDSISITASNTSKQPAISKKEVRLMRSDTVHVYLGCCAVQLVHYHKIS
jgi:Mn2+/Fe2+ NRAMP family transporter